jgi:hypothetical protein
LAKLIEALNAPARRVLAVALICSLVGRKVLRPVERGVSRL